MSAQKGLAFVMALGALAGCTAHGTAVRSEPWGKPAPVVMAEVPVKGFDVSVNTDGDSFSGELLAVDACYVHVARESRTVAIPTATVENVRVQLYPSTAAGAITLLSFLGTLSTPSHGWYLVFSVPIWLSTGIATSVNLAYADDVKVKDGGLLFQFARFPQGLPPGWRVNQVLPGAPASCSLAPPSAAPPDTPPASEPAAPLPTTPPPDVSFGGSTTPPPTPPPSGPSPF